MVGLPTASFAYGSYRVVIFIIHMELASGYLAQCAEFGNLVGGVNLVLPLPIAL